MKGYSYFVEGQEAEAEEGSSRNVENFDIYVIQGLRNWMPTVVEELLHNTVETLLEQKMGWGPGFGQLLSP